jgi:hypothetical protein
MYMHGATHSRRESGYAHQLLHHNHLLKSVSSHITNTHIWSSPSTTTITLTAHYGLSSQNTINIHFPDTQYQHGRSPHVENTPATTGVAVPHLGEYRLGSAKGGLRPQAPQHFSITLTTRGYRFGLPPQPSLAQTVTHTRNHRGYRA